MAASDFNADVSDRDVTGLMDAVCQDGDIMSRMMSDFSARAKKQGLSLKPTHQFFSKVKADPDGNAHISLIAALFGLTRAVGPLAVECLQNPQVQSLLALYCDIFAKEESNYSVAIEARVIGGFRITRWGCYFGKWLSMFDPKKVTESVGQIRNWFSSTDAKSERYRITAAYRQASRTTHKKFMVADGVPEAEANAVVSSSALRDLLSVKKVSDGNESVCSSDASSAASSIHAPNGKKKNKGPGKGRRQRNNRRSVKKHFKGLKLVQGRAPTQGKMAGGRC